MVIQRKEENNYPLAVAISLGLMGIFLLISFFWYVSRAQKEEFGMGGIIVNYGTSETGMGNDISSVEEPSMDPAANGKLPDNVSEVTSKQVTAADNSDRDLVTQDVEDAPTVEKNPKKTNAAPTVKPVEDAKPVINKNALFKGAANNAKGGGDGTGTVPGNQGSVNGDPLSTNYGEGGSGNGTLFLERRSFTRRPQITDDGRQDGTIAVELRVGKDGTVVNARVVLKGTTITDKALWQKCVDAVKGARLNQLDSAPEEQVGRIVFNFKNN